MRSRNVTAILTPLFAALCAVGCSTYRPSAEEIEARNEEFRQYCADLRDEIADEDNILRKATSQERYNQECLGRTYPNAGDT